jgi:hypothetical protein
LFLRSVKGYPSFWNVMTAHPLFMWIVVIAFCWSISSYQLLLLLQSTEH